MNGKEILNEVLKELPNIGTKNVCIALSGGLDSTTLVYTLTYKYGADKVKALAFDFGQRHVIELEMAQNTADILGIDFQIIKLDYLADMARGTSALIEGSDLKPKTAEENSGDPQVNTYVPWRNAQFAFITAAYAETHNCNHIFQATNAVDNYGYFDTTIEFRDALNNVFMLNRQNPVELVTPFVEMYKDEELLLAKELSEIYIIDILKNTWSCYNGDNGSGKECGVCNTCTEKLTGYIQAGYSTEVILDKFDISQEYLDDMKGDIL